MMALTEEEKTLELEFRPLRDDDLPLLHGWLNEPGVVRWWEGDDVTWEAVVSDYGSSSDDPTEHWICTLDGEPLGWLQCFAIEDYADSDYSQQCWRLGVERTAASIDYLIGDRTKRGGGLGQRMISDFVDRIVFGRHPGWTEVCAAPMEDNIASWRALEKAGFAHTGTFEQPHGRVRLMVVGRRSEGHGPRSVLDLESR